MPFIPSSFSLRCKADLSIPIKSAVLEIFPWFFFSCVVKYSFSKCFLASFKGDEKDFSIKFLFWYEDDGFRISSISLLILDCVSLDERIVILSTKFLNSLTLPGQS